MASLTVNGTVDLCLGLLRTSTSAHPNCVHDNLQSLCMLQTCFQATTVSSAMFITAMAANPLAVNLAADALGTTISWGTWALAAIVPGLFTLLTMPLLLYVLYPPKVKDTPDAPIEAKKQLEKLGPMSTDEKITYDLAAS